MKWLLRAFAAVYCTVAILFAVVAAWLLWTAGQEIWAVLMGALPEKQLTPGVVIIESIGLLAVALVAIEISQTIIEEQVIRRAHVSAPTRARRYLSRFFVVLVVAMAIEALVATVTILRSDPTRLMSATWIAFSAAALLIAWGCFIWLNRSAEEIEPEAMEEAKQEDEKLRVDEA